ncbi:Plant invertase/pectin methylesterase inhibitor superfamily [Perilla frutescens var. frutescens]|nr:Plant invertase/pectin methylesterase inhibitor superfamily [Perilla frutescens var. frutescens]
MDNHISILAFLTFHLLLVSHFRLAKCGNATSICTKTPHPELCNTLRSTFPDENDIVLRDLSLRETLAQAADAHKLISEMDLSSFDELGRSAWTDCLELHQDSIYQLNRSVFVGSKTDVQTWLSAAIANQQTCHNGFLDFNLSSHLESFDQLMMLNDFSTSLTNSLAINKAVIINASSSKQKKRNSDDHFPYWVSAGDRRLLRSSGGSVKADIVVARDGSGDYTTISAALDAAKRRRGSKRFVIYVKKGVYKENVEIKKSMKNLMFVGDGIDATVVTSNRNVQDGFTTFRSATFAVSGEGFIARGMTFENTAGPHKHQAVALRSSSDFSVFYDCSFKGYQDTLYVHSQRQFYRNCDVYGTVDFIFGDAVAVLQNCNIYVRKPMIDQKNTVTAQGRKDPNENTGIIIHNSIITASPELRPVQNLYASYLGRPWKKYSTTVFLKCVIDGLIDPAGWLPWSGDFGLTTLYYGEYMNVGGGATVRGRVKWPGFHVIRNAAEAGKFSVGNFLAGDSWLPATGVPFTAGL